MSSSKRGGCASRLASTVTAAGMIVGVAAAGCKAAPESASTPAATASHASRAHAAPGAQLWVSRYDGPANSYPVPSAIAASPDGSAVFVTGASRVQTRQAGYATVGYDAATGRQLWASRYVGPGKAVDVADARASPQG